MNRFKKTAIALFTVVALAACGAAIPQAGTSTSPAALHATARFHGVTVTPADCAHDSPGSTPGDCFDTPTPAPTPTPNPGGGANKIIN